MTAATRLDALLRDGLISLAGYLTARRWRRDWEAALDRGQIGRPGAVQGGPRVGDAVTYRMAAIGRLRASQAALGPVAFRLLELCLVRDASWRSTGALFGVSDKTAMRWTATAIAGLAALHRLRVDPEQGENARFATDRSRRVAAISNT